jgi:uncharacterized protein YecE (DUF72 family)
VSSDTHEGRTHIGTSGWHYNHWVGPYYPEGMDASEFLAYHAERFDTVEVNNSFYSLPKAETLRQWRDTVADTFTFSMKASRYITHMKKLTDPEEPVGNFLDRVSELGDKLGPVLFQLPPNWHFNADRLRHFLGVLPTGYRYTFEFRDPSWFDDRAYAALREHNAAFCIYELAGQQSPKEVTADFVYVRLHGPGAAYQGRYTTQTLTGWAGACATWRRQGHDIYCYFDNDWAGYAVENALELQAMVTD